MMDNEKNRNMTRGHIYIVTEVDKDSKVADILLDKIC